MNRKSFLKALGLLAVAPLVPASPIPIQDDGGEMSGLVQVYDDAKANMYGILTTSGSNTFIHHCDFYNNTFKPVERTHWVLMGENA